MAKRLVQIYKDSDFHNMGRMSRRGSNYSRYREDEAGVAGGPGRRELRPRAVVPAGVRRLRHEHRVPPELPMEIATIVSLHRMIFYAKIGTRRQMEKTTLQKWRD